MATIDVKDAAGSTVAIEKPLAPGRAAAASSRPIALSTEDKASLDSIAAGASLPAGTDKSSSITTGATAQVLAASNSSRKSLVGQNISAGDIWINEIGGTAAVDTVGSYKITTGQAFAIGTNRAISIIGATTGQKFTATET